MRSSADDQSTFRHELVLHSSTEEMLQFVVPFVREGIAAEEQTLLLLRAATAATALHRVGSSPYLTLLPALGRPGRPASDLRDTDTLLAEYEPGTRRVRVLNQEPAVPDTHWHEWRRLEAAVNVALHHHRTWAVCVYDQRSLTDDMVDDLYATHPLVGHAGEHRRNDRYQNPAEFLGKHMDAPPDPIEQTTPHAELLNPTPATARSAVAGCAGHSRLPAQTINDLVLATHEAVSNSTLHGRPPVVLRIWTQPDRQTVTVTDTGTGPTDPFVGLLPPDDPNGAGLGLWVSHQLVDITHRRHTGGYTTHLSAATPH